MKEPIKELSPLLIAKYKLTKRPVKDLNVEELAFTWLIYNDKNAKIESDFVDIDGEGAVLISRCSPSFSECLKYINDITEYGIDYRWITDATIEAESVHSGICGYGRCLLEAGMKAHLSCEIGDNLFAPTFRIK